MGDFLKFSEIIVQNPELLPAVPVIGKGAQIISESIEFKRRLDAKEQEEKLRQITQNQQNLRSHTYILSPPNAVRQATTPARQTNQTIEEVKAEEPYAIEIDLPPNDENDVEEIPILNVPSNQNIRQRQQPNVVNIPQEYRPPPRQPARPFGPLRAIATPGRLIAGLGGLGTSAVIAGASIIANQPQPVPVIPPVQLPPDMQDPPPTDNPYIPKQPENPILPNPPTNPPTTPPIPIEPTEQQQPPEKPPEQVPMDESDEPNIPGGTNIRVQTVFIQPDSYGPLLFGIGIGAAISLIK